MCSLNVSAPLSVMENREFLCRHINHFLESTETYLDESDRPSEEEGNKILLVAGDIAYQTHHFAFREIPKKNYHCRYLYNYYYMACIKTSKGPVDVYRAIGEKLELVSFPNRLSNRLMVLLDIFEHRCRRLMAHQYFSSIQKELGEIIKCVNLSVIEYTDNQKENVLLHRKFFLLCHQRHMIEGGSMKWIPKEIVSYILDHIS